MSGGQEKSFIILGPKLSGSKAQQYYGDKQRQIRIEPIDYIKSSWVIFQPLSKILDLLTMLPDISRCQFPDISGYQIFSSFLKIIWPGLDMICNFWHFSILCPEAWDQLKNRCIRTELWPQGANISLDSHPLGFLERCGDWLCTFSASYRNSMNHSVEKFYSCRVYLRY